MSVNNFGAVCGKKKKKKDAKADLQMETDATQWLPKPLFIFRKSLTHLDHTSPLSGNIELQQRHSTQHRLSCLGGGLKRG